MKFSWNDVSTFSSYGTPLSFSALRYVLDFFFDEKFFLVAWFIFCFFKILFYFIYMLTRQESSPDLSNHDHYTEALVHVLLKFMLDDHILDISTLIRTVLILPMHSIIVGWFSSLLLGICCMRFMLLFTSLSHYAAFSTNNAHFFFVVPLAICSLFMPYNSFCMFVSMLSYSLWKL